VSTHAAQRSRSSTARRRARSRRRRGLLLLVLLAAGALIVAGGLPTVKDAAREITLPLRHEDIIRQQASDKDLDPALIAGVIYTESRFTDQTSHAGARGLMQITPETAEGIAQRTGGVAFEQSDLADPQVNVSYGSWYLRHLLDHYGGNEALALAAYNAGQGNVDAWIAEARAQERGMTLEAIPFPETRAYVESVLEARDDYRETYAAELGL
jgi:soluble lytic murein transglycosylase